MIKSLNRFDFLAIPSLNKALLLELARCEVLSRKENLLLLGNFDHAGRNGHSACLILLWSLALDRGTRKAMPGFSEPPSKAGVTQLLKAWGEGDDVALKQLTPVVENELHRIAHRCMAREKPGHTLQSAALVNEVYLRLVDIPAVSWQDRAHFFAMCARLMRRILTDYARSRNYQKRGGGAVHLTLDEGLIVAPEKGADIMALDEALTRFALPYPRQSQVVELRFFGGLEVDEVAEALKISAVTVRRDWKFAKAWLLRAISGEVRDES